MRTLGPQALFVSACMRTLGPQALLIGGRVRSIVATVLVWLIIQVPRVAVACSVCTAGRDDENAAAFLISTIFMSALPLLAIGSIVFFLVRRIRKFEEEREAHTRRTAAPARPAESA
jgi:large-conductance mechanosensitive channel